VDRLLSDFYEVESFLGTDAVASVYRARSLVRNRLEILKVYSGEFSHEPHFASRLERAARVAASLDHPRILKFVDYACIEDLATMSFIGEAVATLRHELEERGFFDERRVARLGAEVLEALVYAHGLGVLHGDIRPENLLLEPEGRILVSDFAVTNAISPGRRDSIRAPGEKSYVSPEEVRGEPIDVRSDIYSLGATLYQLLTKRIPFRDPDPEVALAKRLEADPPPISLFRHEVSPRFESIVLKAMQRERGERYPTADAMLAAVKLFLAENETVPSAGQAFVPGLGAGPILIPGSPTPTPSPPPLISAQERPPTAKFHVPWSLIGGLAVAGLAVIAVFLATRRVPPAGPATYDVHVMSDVPGAKIFAGSRYLGEAGGHFRLSRPEYEELNARYKQQTFRERTVRNTGPGRVDVTFSFGSNVEESTFENGSAAPSARNPAGPARPQLVREQLPVIPESALRDRVTGVVGIVVIIGTDGKVQSAKVISPLRPDCDQAAVDAALQYTFLPARNAEGQPIESSLALSIQFNLQPPSGGDKP
jgi:TonB family protein